MCGKKSVFSVAWVERAPHIADIIVKKKSLNEWMKRADLLTGLMTSDQGHKRKGKWPEMRGELLFKIKHEIHKTKNPRQDIPHCNVTRGTAIAGVDWPSGVPGFFPVGWSIMGRSAKKSNWASASVRGGQQQGQAAWWREEEGLRGAGDKHVGMGDQQTGTPECPTKWSGRWPNKCTPPWVTAEMRSLPRVLVD